MEIELYTLKEKERFVNVQEVRFLERSICIQRQDENKHYLFPLINIYKISIEGGETKDGTLWVPVDKENE